MLILSSKLIALDTIEMKLRNTYISQTVVPGQFIHIHVAGHMLRRPISVANADPEGTTITIVFKIIGSGTAKLADRKSTRLNSSHVAISYAVFCLKKKIKLQP